ncbi:MAG: Phosphotransferase enzyme family [Paenibacillus sp.]|jgi:thiamine kinase-like enzyme|nr:Phosphotransferase enzyme family [Paenibacillus sp.]
MEELIIQIRRKAEELLNAKVDDIEKLENVTNNSVYKFFCKKPYIFKIFKQRTWPEDGKLIFVNNKLIENQINCAKIIAFDRNDSYFQNGFLLEEYVPGVNADHIVFDLKSGKELYKKLALLVSKIHRIHIDNYGYIGSGVAGYTSFIDFMNDKYDEITNVLINKKLFEKKSLLEIKKPIIDRLRLCESLPSVLNHGDLSTKNVMIEEDGSLTLIDWDDAMSYNWIADIARMTYWMKFKYNDQEYEKYRNTFLEHYSAANKQSDFDTFEKTFHVWIGLDHLNFYANTSQYEDTMTYFKETIEKLS